MNDNTVFGFGRGEGADAGAGDPDWIVAKDRFKYDQLFDTLNPVDGKITGSCKALGVNYANENFSVYSVILPDL